jgi:hypothetical protein
MNRCLTARQVSGNFPIRPLYDQIVDKITKATITELIRIGTTRGTGEHRSHSFVALRGRAGVLVELRQPLPVEEAEVEDLDHDSANGGRVLSPGTRMIERAGVLHFYDGRRLVSLDTDQQIRNAIAAVAALANTGTDLTELSKRLRLDEATVEQLVGLLNANALIDTTTTPSPWPASAPAQFVSGLGTTPVSSSLADERRHRFGRRPWAGVRDPQRDPPGKWTVGEIGNVFGPR